jgi:CBS domain-containing protein
MKTVRDIMNAKLLYVRDGDRMTLVRSTIVQFGVTGVPVLDENHRPVGFVSLRDIDGEGHRIRTSEPAVTVRDTDSIADGAKKLAASSCHHLVVVDEKGVAVGMVSAVDFLRALTGVEVRHPPRFDVNPTHSED